MYEDELKTLSEKMDKSINALKSEFTSIRTGQANASLLDRIFVEYYGSRTPVTQVASVTVPEARMLVVQPWDKSLLKEIEKAILQSDLGLVPMNDGNLIRMAIPQLTEERRKELVGEGHAFFDYMRNGKSVDRSGGWHLTMPEDARVIAPSDPRVALPIPQTEIDANPNIVQNPR